MGYTTIFSGRFELDKSLKPEQITYLKQFSETRHMLWRLDIIEKISDPIREAVGLPLGEDGCYFVARDDFSLAEDANRPTKSQPSLYCKWISSDDGKGIEWDGREKFGWYWEWLWYLIKHFLKPWGYTLNGSVPYQG